MGIAAYNRGTRAISRYIDQQLAESRIISSEVVAPVKKMWQPPAGWFKAALAARAEREDMEFRIEDNERRRQHGLPTYEV